MRWGLSRDPSRTPFQWAPNAGSSDGVAWLPLDPEYRSCNVESLRKESTSVLSLYRRLLSLRRQYVALNSGALLLVSVQGNVLVFERTAGDQRVLVCLNFGGTSQPISEQALSGSTILVSTYLDRSGRLDDLLLRPNEGLTILMKEKS